jgi:hypothetical protein
MGVVHVRHMRMAMHELLVAVPMRVRLTRPIIGTMGMLVVSLMNVQMAMLHLLMYVLVLDLGQVKPDAKNHQSPSNDQLQG